MPHTKKRSLPSAVRAAGESQSQSRQSCGTAGLRFVAQNLKHQRNAAKYLPCNNELKIPGIMRHRRLVDQSYEVGYSPRVPTPKNKNRAGMAGSKPYSIQQHTAYSSKQHTAYSIQKQTAYSRRTKGKPKGVQQSSARACQMPHVTCHLPLAHMPTCPHAT